MNDKQKHKVFDKNCIMLFVTIILFFAVDAINVSSEKALRAEFETDFTQNNQSTQESKNFSQTAPIANQEISSLSTIKTVTSFVSVVLLIILLIVWFKVTLVYKFITIAFMLIYSAGMHFIDFEYLVQLSEFGKNMQVAKYLIIRLFPPVLFILLFIATILYKPLPKPE